MGFAVTEPREKSRRTKPTSPRKTASGEFFAKPNRTRLENRRQPLKTQVGKPTYAYKIASGRPFWPSRDPIEEKGGLNLYGFVRNNGIGFIDFLGWAKYYVGRESHEVTGIYGVIPNQIGAGYSNGWIDISITLNLRPAKKLIESDLGHHNAIIWCEDDGDDTKHSKRKIGLFADNIADAAIGYAKEIFYYLSPEIGIYLYPSWSYAGEVPGTIQSYNDDGDEYERHEITKEQFDAGVKLMDGLVGTKRKYHITKNNCQHFTQEIIKKIKN